MSKLSDLKKELVKFQKQIEKKTEKAIKEEFKKLFEAFPILQAVRFEIWAPTWNDGDACTVGLHNISFKLDYTEEQLDELEIENENGFICEDSLYGLPKDDEQYKELFSFMNNEDINELTKDLCSMVDILNSIFGDPVEVVVTRKGIKVESCEPDY